MNSKEISLEVLGMTCRSCVGHVHAALSALDGVSRVEVRFRDGKVVVEYTPELLDENTLLEALREAGYESSVSAAA
jgi:copper chaperone CopZ